MKPLRIAILEEALQSGHGHWPSYIGGMARAWRGNGDTVDILAHREAKRELLGETGAFPVYSRSCWTDARSQGLIGGLRHNHLFYRETLRFLGSRPGHDWILSLTTRTQHLLGFAALVHRIPPPTRFLLLFVQGFGHFQGEGLPARFPSSPSIRFARFCFHLLAPAVRAGRVHLAAETAAMRDELTRFSGLPVQLFPHPVPTPSFSPAHDAHPKTFTLACPGFARHEKGSDLLLTAIPKILSGPWAGRVRFVLQWPSSFPLPDGSSCSPSETLRSDPSMDFINEALDEPAYHRLLDRTHGLILPYRLKSYHNRISRVALEGAARGIPLVYTRGSSPDELGLPSGAAFTCLDNDPDSLADAILNLLDHWPSASSAARQASSKVAQFHSAEEFRSRLFNPNPGCP